MKPHLCESQMTIDMRSRGFWNKSDTSWKYPAKKFVRRSIFHRNTFYRSVIIEVNWSPQILAHKEDGVSFLLLFLCVSQKTHRQTVNASAVNSLRQKRKKRTLAKHWMYILGLILWNWLRQVPTEQLRCTHLLSHIHSHSLPRVEVGCMV